MTAALFEIEDSDATSSAVTPAFARHETFHPRYGWLKKGFDAAVEDPTIFLRPDATTTLGVGKNMVRAMRYWCLAYKVLGEQPAAENPRLREVVPTSFGRALLGDRGWDPYVEQAGTLWLLHWTLMRRPCLAPSWHIAFNELPPGEFTDGALSGAIASFSDAQDGWPDVAENSIKKDVRCILRMYASVTSGIDLPEDSVDSPFAELELIQGVAGSRMHNRFRTGEKRTLPSLILGYCCLDYAVLTASPAMISLSRLTHEPGSPGAAFKLTESAMAEQLENFCRANGDAVMTDAAGALQLVFGSDPRYLRARVLPRFYGREETE